MKLRMHTGAPMTGSPSFTSALEVEANKPHPLPEDESVDSTTTVQENEMVKEAAISKLKVHFDWISVLPRKFSKKTQTEGKDSEPWIVNGLEEVVAYLNIHLKKKTWVNATTENLIEYPSGVVVIPPKLSVSEIKEAQSSVQSIFENISTGNFRELVTKSDSNVILFYTPFSHDALDFRESMVMLNHEDPALFACIHIHTKFYLEDMGINISSDDDPTHSSAFWKFMNENCHFSMVYYPPNQGSLQSHVDSIIPIHVTGNIKLRRDGPIYTLNLNFGEKCTDLFPVWQPLNTSTVSEPAYRLKTYLGQTTKLSGLDGRFRFSHGIPGGNTTKGYTAVWKWNEQNQDQIQQWNRFIYVDSTSLDSVEYNPKTSIRKLRKGKISKISVEELNKREHLKKLTEEKGDLDGG